MIGDRHLAPLDLARGGRTHDVHRQKALAAPTAYTFNDVTSLALWYRSPGTVSIESVGTPKAEMFYWVTIMFSQTLGTALGDWTADTIGLGYVGGIASAARRDRKSGGPGHSLQTLAIAADGCALASGRFLSLSTATKIRPRDGLRIREKSSHTAGERPHALATQPTATEQTSQTAIANMKSHPEEYKGCLWPAFGFYPHAAREMLYAIYIKSSCKCCCATLSQSIAVSLSTA